MDIFEYEDVRQPSRSLQDQEEEADAAPTAHLFLEPPIVLRNEEAFKAHAPDGTLRPEVLLVACSRSACALLGAAFPGAQPLGSLVLPDISMEGNTALPSLRDNTCFLHACGPSGRATWVACQVDVPAERAGAWVRGLFAAAQPKRTLILGSMSAESYRGEEDPSQSCLLHYLQTSAVASTAVTPAPLLPTGNVVSGTVAALLGYCEPRGLAAEAILTIDMVPGKSSASAPGIGF